MLIHIFDVVCYLTNKIDIITKQRKAGKKEGIPTRKIGQCLCEQQLLEFICGEKKRAKLNNSKSSM